MKITNANILIFCLISFVVGIGVAGFLPVSLAGFQLMIFALGAVSLVLAVIFWKNKMIRISALVVLFLLLGVWRFFISIPENTPDKIWYYNSQEVNIAGTICEEPDLRQSNQKLTVKIKSISNPQSAIRNPQDPPRHGTTGTPLQGGELEVSGKILVTTDLYPQYEYGDEIEFRCLLKAPEAFDEFAYDKYLARYDVYSICFYPKAIINVQSSIINNNSVLRKKIIDFKKRIRDIINSGLPEPEAGLANAMLLGYKKGVNNDLRNNFSRTGLSHIMAISGLHIGIISVGIFGVLMYLGIRRQIAFWIGLSIISIYIIMIGAPASAIRAGIMGSLILLALNLGRLSNSLRALILTAGILLAFNPKLLASDIGFQLSFLAIAGIIIFFPRLKKFCERKFKFRNRILVIILDLVLVSISAQILTLPIIAYNFGVVSFIAPLTNLLALPLLPALIVALIGGTIGGAVFPIFAWIFFTPAFLILHYVVWLVEVMAIIPWGAILLK